MDSFSSSFKKFEYTVRYSHITRLNLKINLSNIQHISTAVPAFKHAQKDIAAFILNMYKPPAGDWEKVERMFDRSEIDTRYSVLDDFSLPPESWKFFNPHTSISTEHRMNKYFELALVLALQAVEKLKHQTDLHNITHLITVSCTGMAAPGLDIMLVDELSLPNHVHRLGINFMGCYAGMLALKQAHTICVTYPDAKVLIVDVELCTLHFQQNYTLDNAASSLLFADGAAAIIVSNGPRGLKIKDFYTELAIQGLNDMTWSLSSTGFLMTLSGYVPQIIAEHIRPLLDRALGMGSLTKEEITHWAIHPGGKKIIQEIEKALELKPADTLPSRKVLREYGNMSSVTLFFVLEEIMNQSVTTGESIFACAFGPGLTLETMIAEVC